MPPSSTLRLWDVANAEAHVHTTLEAGLRAAGARLNQAQKQRAFAFLLAKCWELSGLEADGRTLRHVYEVRGFLVPRSLGGQFTPIRLPQFPRRATAELALEQLQERRRICFAEIAEVRPRGAYNPSFGIAFSTYSRRILTQRIWDWYRSDPEFGDSRYESHRAREESLDALVERWEHNGTGAHEDYLDRRSPGARAEFVDELNRHAYQESIEEVLTHAAIGR